MPYKLSTRKTWSQTLDELADTMQKWGVKEWNVKPTVAPRKQYQSPIERTVTLTYTKAGQPVTLTMDKQARAEDNLRVLYLACEDMRLNDLCGIADVVAAAYSQELARVSQAPGQAAALYATLGVRMDADWDVIEAAYKAAVRKAHPDAGGSHERMAELNAAMEQIRKLRGK